jgi:glycosyltransferase involved in cell wall biosynthesis
MPTDAPLQTKRFYGKLMKISAIIPTFNRRTYILRAVDSVLAQTAPIEEIIIVDDGSTDGTAEFVYTWYGSRVRIVKQERTGVSGARRRGTEEAQGEWIAFLDSDDEWTPDRNRALCDAIERAPSDVAWIFGDLRLVTDKGTEATLFSKYGLSVKEHPHIFVDPLSVQHPFQFGMLQGSVIRRKALLELNCFSEGLRHSEDVLAGFQVACRYRFAAIPSVVGSYFRTSDLATSSVALNSLYRADYHRARMMAFALVIKSGQKRPWNMYYASHVRALCQELANGGQVRRSLAIQQFRFGGISAKGMAFFCAVMLGRRGVQAWNSLAGLRKKPRPLPETGSFSGVFKGVNAKAGRT